MRLHLAASSCALLRSCLPASSPPAARAAASTLPPPPRAPPCRDFLPSVRAPHSLLGASTSPPTRWIWSTSSTGPASRSSSHKIGNALKQHYREDESQYLASDSDKQLLIYILFMQVVKLHSALFRGPEDEESIVVVDLLQI